MADLIALLRACYDEEAAELDHLTSDALVQGYLRVHGDRLKASIQADRELLERYDYCVDMECPGNADLAWARWEYEQHVFPLRIARFSDHPAHAALVASRWVPEDYAALVEQATT